MSYHNGLDLIAIATNGDYSSHFGLGEEDILANLYISQGYLENAPDDESTSSLQNIFFGFY